MLSTLPSTELYHGFAATHRTSPYTSKSRALIWRLGYLFSYIFSSTTCLYCFEIMPHRQMSSKSSSSKRILLRLAVVVAALLFYYDYVRVLIVPIVKNEHPQLRADATQQDKALISGSAVTQKNYTTATGDRTNVTNTGIVGNSLQKADNINNENASGLVLPNILIIGAQKAGTSSIAALLTERKNGVCQAQTFPGEPKYYQKEVHFFDMRRYNEGIEFYAKRFEKCVSEDKQFMLDATPAYLNQARRVYETYTDKKAQISAIENLKLICVLREPISRELSWYNHKLSLVLQSDERSWLKTVVHANSTFKTFDEYSDELAQRIKKVSFNGKSFYVDYLKEWVKWFDRKKLLILSYDELHKDPSMLIQRIEKFLGTKLTGSFPHRNSKEIPQKVKEVSLHAKEVLGRLFKDKNEELYRFIEDHPGPPMEQNPFPRFKDI